MHTFYLMDTPDVILWKQLEYISQALRAHTFLKTLSFYLPWPLLFVNDPSGKSVCDIAEISWGDMWDNKGL